jgi:hypothetical protein
MKIHANFWLDDEDETSIPMSMYDLTAPPFKVGDRITLSVDDLVPKDYNSYKPDVAKRFIEDNNAAREMFNFKTIEIVRVGNYARFNTVRDGSLTYEYHCKFVEEQNVETKTKI